MNALARSPGAQPDLHLVHPTPLERVMALARSEGSQPDLHRARLPAMHPRIPPVPAAVSANARKVRASYVAPNQWWRQERLPAVLDGDKWLDFWAYFMVEGRQPLSGFIRWTQHDQRKIEYCFWLYELHARMRGLSEMQPKYLFGAAIPEIRRDAGDKDLLHNHALVEIQRVGHPMDGCVEEAQKLAWLSRGLPVLLPGDRKAQGPANTPWTHIVIGKKRAQRSSQPVSINRACSDNEIGAELKRRAPEIGLKISQNRGLRIAKSARAGTGWESPGRLSEGETMRIGSWGVIEAYDAYFKASATSNNGKGCKFPKAAKRVADRHADAIEVAEEAWKRDGNFLIDAGLA